jgi:hypothetical protein
MRAMGLNFAGNTDERNYHFKGNPRSLLVTKVQRA